MNLSDYEWSNNPRGMHGAGDNHERWSDWQLGWINMVYQDNSALNWGAFALAKGMTPIVRIYRPELSGKPMDDGLRSQYQAHLNAGIKWFEYYNEPNLPFEWPQGVDLRPDNLDLIRPVCDNWLGWAEFIINGGGYPGFISLSETSEPWGDTGQWIINLLRYMFDNHYDRFRSVINNGMWLSTHPYLVNHWYQEMPGGGGLSARQPMQINHQEGGWHFEYPYDPICQADDPGRTIWGGTPTTPGSDMIGLLAAGIGWLEKLQEMFGVGWIPVVGTEGGIWHIPQPGEQIQQDGRYPPYDLNSHAHGTVAVFDWLTDVAPAWMFGLCLWRWHDYWNLGNPLPALSFLNNSPVKMKTNIPAYPALGNAPPPYDTSNLPASDQIAQQPTQEPVQQPTQQPTQAATATPLVTLVPSGPGPVHGNPSNHFVLLADSLPTNWVFDSNALANYWERFRPALIPDAEFIDFLPYDTSLALTIISPPDTLASLQDSILSRWSTVQIDAVAVNSAANLEVLFAERVQNGVRF